MSRQTNNEQQNYMQLQLPRHLGGFVAGVDVELAVDALHLRLDRVG
jgi:hypothetical protein